MPPRICVVGSSNMDLIVRTARLPQPGETLIAKSFATCPGGKGGNQAVLAARLGAKVTIIGKVGRDAFGEQIRKGYEAEGIDTTYLFDGKEPTGVAMIAVDAQGDNTILVVSGANGELDPRDLSTASAAIKSADVLLCQLEVPLETTCEALRLAHEANVLTILNPAPYQPLPAAMSRIVDLLVPNETELKQLTGSPIPTPRSRRKAAQRLFDTTGIALLVTLGEQGVLGIDRNGQSRWDAFDVEAVDTSGAGDAFLGALSVYLGKRVSFSRAVERAMAIAALTVTRPGTQSSYPTGREAAAFLRKHGLTSRG